MLEQIRLSLVIREFENISLSVFADARWDDFVEILLRLRQSSSVTLAVTIYDSHGSYVVSMLKERLAPLTGRVQFLLHLKVNIDPESIGEDVHWHWHYFCLDTLMIFL